LNQLYDLNWNIIKSILQIYFQAIEEMLFILADENNSLQYILIGLPFLLRNLGMEQP
jgi:hypothetical protein